MSLRFPRFSQGLTQDPTTCRIWFGISTTHDFESHDDITEERLYQNIFASHFSQLAIIFLWTFRDLFHIDRQGNFESWVQDPLHWWHTIGLCPNENLYTDALFVLFLSSISLIVGYTYNRNGNRSYYWFKNAESRLNHHLSGLLGGLVHVAIPASKGDYVRWNNLLDVLSHPQGLGPHFTKF
uniref:Uncharacterized protein n=1 Tax=Solanum lycopersicum TaxID=4081 RepID=A0A3Q7ICJ1_SOLLC